MAYCRPCSWLIVACSANETTVVVSLPSEGDMSHSRPIKLDADFLLNSLETNHVLPFGSPISPNSDTEMTVRDSYLTSLNRKTQN